MLKICLLMAEVAPLDVIPPPHQTNRLFGMALKDFLLIIGVLLLLSALLFAITWYTRRDPRKHAPPGKRVLYRAADAEDGSGRRVKRRKRRLHPDNLPRNPTLAEAGGLPPIREEPPQPAC